MEIIYGLKKIRRFKSPVVAVGVFDGVHKAHRYIIKAAVSQAKREGSESIVVTFWPDPQGQKSLYSLEHRCRIFEELGVEVCIVLKFSKKFAQIRAENFVKNVLVRDLDMRSIYVGENFNFGRNSEGNVTLLRKLSSDYGFKVHACKVLKAGEDIVSSTLIRKLILKGELKKAERALLRPVSVLGTVIKGDSLALKLGFPTANIDPRQEILPPHGVYAARAVWHKNYLPGICYIGNKPTFLNGKINIKHPGSKRTGPPNIEIHIFDFHENIYGQELEVQFIKKIRDEKKFDSIISLSKQIKRDVHRVKKIYSRH